MKIRFYGTFCGRSVRILGLYLVEKIRISRGFGTEFDDEDLIHLYFVAPFDSEYLNQSRIRCVIWW